MSRRGPNPGSPGTRVIGRHFIDRPCLAAFALFLLASGSCAVADNAPVTITVDTSLNRHPISPYVYGVALGAPYVFNGPTPNTTVELEDLNTPLNRYGGDNSSRYNWQINADNRGLDFFFESIPDDSPIAGERADTFISQSLSAGTAPMITVPMLEWVARLGPDRSRLASFSVAKYGAQTAADPDIPDDGNGVLKDNGAGGVVYVTGNDPTDANVPNTPAIEESWVEHIVVTSRGSANGGVKFYILDNEPSLWHQEHRDVHPVGAKMGDVAQQMLAYSAAIKSADSTALVVGPEEYGWYGFLFSGYDQQYSVANNGATPDRDANGGMDNVAFLLDQLHRDDVASGRRSLDIFSLHWYPGSGEFSSTDVSAATQLLRNRSTRSLWDPDYIDAQGLFDPISSTSTAKVMLIPRMKNWVATYYPGLQTAITEYNWGAESNINGATAQADVLGIFGREGLDYATRYTTPDPGTPTYKAIKMYRNYDGNKSTFGDVSVSATVPDPDQLSAFAASRTADGATTVMVINKVAAATPVAVVFPSALSGGVAQAWQLTSANTITRLADIDFSGAGLQMTAPAQSITLLVLPKSASSTSGGGGGAFDQVLLLMFAVFAGLQTLLRRKAA